MRDLIRVLDALQSAAAEKASELMNDELLPNLPAEQRSLILYTAMNMTALGSVFSIAKHRLQMEDLKSDNRMTGNLSPEERFRRECVLNGKDFEVEWPALLKEQAEFEAATAHLRQPPVTQPQPTKKPL